MKINNPCLNCLLPDCSETNINCLLWKGRIKPYQKYYRKMKDDLAYKAMRYEIKIKWRKTPAGRESMRKTAARWRLENPEKVKKSCREYHERNKEERLAAAREYKRRKRAEGRNYKKLQKEEPK